MVARTIRVACLPVDDHHGTPISPDVHPRGAETDPLPVRSRHAAAWLRAAQAQVDALQLRADARRGLLAVIWQLALIARTDCTTMPTWSALAEATGLSRATVARHLRRLRLVGLLAVLETGSTPATRGRWDLTPREGNRAALYCLTQPASTVPAPRTAPPAPQKINETPRVTPEGGSSFLRAGARKKHCLKDDLTSWSMTATTSTRTEELAAAAVLRRVSLDLHPISARWIRSKVREWLRAGWTVADLLWAIDHDPNGTPRTWTGTAANPAAWLPARLAAWIGHQAPSAVAAATQQRQRRAQAVERVATGRPALTQHAYDQAHQDAHTAALEAQQPRSVNTTTNRVGAAACRAALAAARARRVA